MVIGFMSMENSAKKNNQKLNGKEMIRALAAAGKNIKSAAGNK